MTALDRLTANPHPNDYDYDEIGTEDGETCSVDSCNTKVRSKGLCSKHYERMRAHGTTVLQTQRTMKVRPVRVVGDIAYVTLTKGYHAIIDASDAQVAGTHNWSAFMGKRTVYAARNSKLEDGKGKATIFLHREILTPEDGFYVDHISGNGLDCRRINLRPATCAQNAQNSRRRKDNKSGLKGVSWHKQRGAWVAQISVHGKRRHIGLFPTKYEAHEAYKEFSKQVHGEFGRSA